MQSFLKSGTMLLGMLSLKGHFSKRASTSLLDIGSLGSPLGSSCRSGGASSLSISEREGSRGAVIGVS